MRESELKDKLKMKGFDISINPNRKSIGLQATLTSLFNGESYKVKSSGNSVSTNGLIITQGTRGNTKYFGKTYTYEKTGRPLSNETIFKAINSAISSNGKLRRGN